VTEDLPGDLVGTAYIPADHGFGSLAQEVTNFFGNGHGAVGYPVAGGPNDAVVDVRAGSWAVSNQRRWVPRTHLCPGRFLRSPP
jgi:hypothetical protein